MSTGRGLAAVRDDDLNCCPFLILVGAGSSAPTRGFVVLDVPVSSTLDLGAWRWRCHLTCGLAVDRDCLHLQTAQVEIEAVQVLSGDEADGRDPIQLTDDGRGGGRWWRVRDVQVVVLDVVPPLPANGK